MSSLPEESNLGAEDGVRAAGYAAFGQLDWGMAVMDLEYDSVIDSPVGQMDDVRRLRFAGLGCMVEIELRGCARVSVDVSVTPDDSVVVELCTRHELGLSRIKWSRGLSLSRARPQLSSFYVRWPDTSRRPVRTAWLML